MKRAPATAPVAVLSLLCLSWAEPSVPALSREHVHPSGAFSFRTPDAWKVEANPSQPELLQASGDGVVVRFLWRAGDWGYDSLHVLCMLERLAGPMDMMPRVKYEYDFLSGKIGNRRFLDSAFAVRYDQPIGGHRDWRQRNLTLVGDGQSLCIITYAPAALWKKSRETRVLLDSVVGSVTPKPSAQPSGTERP